MPSKPGLIVLCTGNSCRSQMAEAFLRGLVGDRFAVYSAGTEPGERVHPLAVRVMKEKGFDLSQSRPEHLREYLGVVPIHTAIIVCDGANKTCPAVWPGAFDRLFWPFDDPAAAEGTEDEKLEVFRRVRDEIEDRIGRWVAEERPGV